MTETTLLLRQIHPTFFQAGVLSSQAFRPTEEHHWKLSVYDGDLISPEASFKHYTLKLASVAVFAVSVAECDIVQLPTKSSPEEFAEHCHIDFTGLGTNAMDKKGRKLRDKALSRGLLYAPSAGGSSTLAGVADSVAGISLEPTAGLDAQGTGSASDVKG